MKESPIYDPNTGFGGDGVPGTYTLPPDPQGLSSAFPSAYRGCVQTGPFRNQTVRLGPGRLITTHCLVRGVDEASKTSQKSSEVARVMALTPFERFRTGLENGVGFGFGFGIHGGGHSAVGGEMMNPYSSPAGMSTGLCETIITDSLLSQTRCSTSTMETSTRSGGTGSRQILRGG